MKVSYLLMCMLLFPFLGASAQNNTITGKVTSSDSDEGLPGVNVIVKGTSMGTVTDIEGAYSLEVPGTESILVFSSVGYVQEEVVVGNNTIVDLVLTEDVTSLEEIVVVGYGTQKRTKVTGAIAEVESEQLLKAPATIFFVVARVPDWFSRTSVLLVW